MLIHTKPPIHLTYCMNVHPGESREDVLSSIRRFPTQIRARVAPGSRFGLGLRLGHRAVEEFAAAPRNVQELKELLAAENFYVFTLNGFPYGRFHGTPVKEDVYRPDWSTQERLDYTRRLACFLTEILPPGQSGGISTVPLSYRAWGNGPDRLDAMVARLAEMALILENLSREGGRDLHLGLEPEPDCLLETTAETIRFFHDGLFAKGARVAARKAGCSRNTAEKILRRRLGICLDTCHAALQFETPTESLARFVAGGIRISKIQLSAALTVSAAKRQSLEKLQKAFPDDVYLHQVKGRTEAGKVFSAGDLPGAPGKANRRGGNSPVWEWRIHFHVPLHFPGNAAAGSTADLIDNEFLSSAAKIPVEHLEIETYTFDVLPASLRGSGRIGSIAEEYAWVIARLAAAGYSTT